jgi:hypothetical protein
LVKKGVKYTQNPDFIYRKIVEEMILVPIHKDTADLNSIFTLNEVGAYLWEHLAEPASFEDLKASLLGEYDVSAETAEADLVQFLGDLEAYGALREV